MVYKVVDLIVAVDQGPSIFWLCLRVLEERHRVLEVWDIADCFFGFNIDGHGLVGRYSTERLELAVVES